MLFPAKFLPGIQRGAITLAFRRWHRPSVRAGGTLLTAVGELQIGAVEAVAVESISEADARRAGYATRAALRADLARRDGGDVYRIELVALGPDPRVALRASPASEPEEIEGLLARLRRLDARSSRGPWTRRVLELIADHPAVRAGRLCELAGQERDAFKLDVRKLKALGLTESLEVGYRISPRGEALLAMLRSRERDDGEGKGGGDERG